MFIYIFLRKCRALLRILTSNMCIMDYGCLDYFTVYLHYRLNSSWAITESSNRIIEYFGSEGTFRAHLAQLPYNEQGHLQLDQVAQSPIQPDLECCQGWGIYHLSGQSVPVFHHPRCKNFFLISSLNLPSFSLKLLTFCPIATMIKKRRSERKIWKDQNFCLFFKLWFKMTPIWLLLN